VFTWREGDLNQKQEEAIWRDGNVFLIACPGSGKTRTLTYKIAYELSKITSSKKFIIAITYTHRAADEIHERIENLGVDTTQLWIGTIHSFCLEWIIKPYFIYHDDLKRGYRVIDQHERELLLTELCEPYRNVTHWDCDYFVTKDRFYLSSQDTAKHAYIFEVLNQYFERLRQARQLDFEQILRCAHTLIVTRPTISAILSNLFSFILIDEYQDTKEIQYAIVAAILKAGAGNTNMFIVGDPNQGIYESLGGFPIAIEELKVLANMEFSELALSQNYRSSGRIVDYFGNYNCFSTEIEAASAEREYQSLITWERFVNKNRLEDEIVRLIKINIEEKRIAPHEICILAPQWSPLASMTRKLVARLPEYSFYGPGMVPFARDMDNFWYKVSKIALTEPSPVIYLRRLRWAADLITDMGDAGVDTSNLTKKKLLRYFNSIHIDDNDGLNYLRKFFDALFAEIGIDFQLFPALRDHHQAFFVASLARIDILTKDGLVALSNIANFRKVFQIRSGITLSTIHGVKGAEFDTVIAFALLEDMVPHFKAINKTESAKKLLYVIGSRARKNLHLISETGRRASRPTNVLATCDFDYDDLT
jgi:DNA helicase-2/ATP-dependent DNA helicase PcrA